MWQCRKVSQVPTEDLGITVQNTRVPGYPGTGSGRKSYPGKCNRVPGYPRVPTRVDLSGYPGTP
eukprot:829118-Rhodomonas_salina.3